MNRKVIQRLIWKDGRAPDSFAALISVQFAFSVTLTLTSFIMAYLFRSPMNALLAVVPVMILFVMAFVNLERTLVVFQDTRVRWDLLTHPQWWSLAGLIAASALFLFGLHQWAAKRRLVGPETELPKSLNQSVSGNAFRPPRLLSASWYGGSIGRARPGKMRALLWQASRQSFWTLVLLTIVASIGVTVALADKEITAELAGLVSGIALFAIREKPVFGM
jgi:hypothetical protein